MSYSRRDVLGGIGGLTALAFSRPLFAREEFPSKPITLIVPFAPGGNIDIVARTIAEPLGRLLGISLIVDNRAGGGGAIGSALLARAPADGYTLMIGTAGQVVTLPQMFKTPYATTSFEPLGLVSRTSIAAIKRRSDGRFATMQEFVAYAKANPGKLNGGHAGAGTPNHLGLLQMENALNVRFTMIPYKGMGPALVDLLAGQIDIVADQVSSSMPHIKAGTLQALSILGPERDPAFASVPTLEELGLGKFDMTTYAGILAPAGVPPQVKARLVDAIRRASAEVAYANKLRELGSTAFSGTPERFAAVIQEEGSFSAKLVAEGRLKAE